jgi:endonuclease/exonuclease/phosphatase family metal-dependent hydrolase
VNGLRFEKDGGQFHEICKIHQEIQADILCIQEHNLDSTQYHVNQTLQQTARKHWQRSRLSLASSPIMFTGTWKPGGTAILSTGSITGRITATGSDAWGRWCYHTFQGQHLRHITIITVYQVVEKFTTDKGQYTAASQQRSLLIRQGELHLDPRKAFQRDLRSFLQQLQELRHEVMILGDFNERLGDNIHGTAQLAAEFNLTDILSIQHPHLQDTATYTRGHKRLDFALGSDRVAMAVQACGYEPFNYRFHSDHRAYFIDLNTELLFGSATQQLSQPSNRILHSNNIKQVTRYIEEKHALLQSCNAFARAEQLSLPGERHQFAERLDADVLRMSIIAERRTQRFREPAWSVELARARHRVSILSKALTMAKTGIDHTTIIQHALERNPDPDDNNSIPDTVEGCSTALRRAKSKVHEIINRCYATRESERDKQIEQLELEIASTKANKATKAKLIILRNLKKAEAIKKMFQKLQNLRRTRQRGGITRLEVPVNPNDDPKTCIHWKVIDIPTDILAQLIRRNRKHFGQAHGTPFTVPPLSDDLAFTSMTLSGELILNGQYDAAHLDTSVQLLIQHLYSNERASKHALTPSITFGEFVGKLKTWRESTSTSPSGLHLGHYKALLARHEFSDLPERDPRRSQFEQKQNDILTLHHQMINYCLENGYSYQRWHQVVNAMIFKEPGNIKIHRTRVIHLYEADYNLAMGLKWKAAMELSEKSKTLNTGQYGSRPSRGAYDPVFIEEFQMEIARSSRKSLVQINYDATSCYDRIIPNLAALVSQRFGVPQPVVKANVRTLENAKYKLRTELGISEEYYTHNSEHPIYGTGQGSGNSPMIWCFLSSILFDSYESQAIGSTFATPDKRFATKIHMVGYVDDSNGQTNRFGDNKQPDDVVLLRDAQHDAQCWHDLLNATGGALELPKCSYQLISWRFLNSGLPVLQAGVSPFALNVNFADQTGSTRTQAIPGMSAYTAHKTLGLYKDPNGAQVRQRKELADKCTKAAAFISRSPLNRDEAWTYYFAIFLPSVGYPLPLCHFSKPVLEKIQRTVMSSLIAKCGYNRKTKREIIYGPAQLGGANFRPLYSVQGVGQTISFLKYWRSPCQAGKLLRIAVAWTQLSLGTSISFLRDTDTRLPHMESKWLASLREYMKYVRGWIELDQEYTPNTVRVHDCHIMDIILASNQFSDTEIRQLNYCRLFLL